MFNKFMEEWRGKIAGNPACSVCQRRKRTEAIIKFVLRKCPQKWKQKAVGAAMLYLLSEVISKEELMQYARTR